MRAGVLHLRVRAAAIGLNHTSTGSTDQPHSSHQMPLALRAGVSFRRRCCSAIASPGMLFGNTRFDVGFGNGVSQGRRPDSAVAQRTRHGQTSPVEYGARGGNRTPDLDVRTVLLYPLSYAGNPVRYEV
jgi:hypothetical protein